MTTASMSRYTLGAYLLLFILKIDGKHYSGGKELDIPLLKSHYNNYSITKSQKGLPKNIIVND